MKVQVNRLMGHVDGRDSGKSQSGKSQSWNHNQDLVKATVLTQTCSQPKDQEVDRQVSHNAFHPGQPEIFQSRTEPNSNSKTCHQLLRPSK